MGDGLWTDWSLCFVAFCIVRCGIRFFFSLSLSLSLLVSTLLLFYATKEVVLFLTINLKSFISLDFRNIITKISPTFRQYNSGWTQFIKEGCIFFFCIDILILMYFQRDQV